MRASNEFKVATLLKLTKQEQQPVQVDTPAADPEDKDKHTRVAGTLLRDEEGCLE